MHNNRSNWKLELLLGDDVYGVDGSVEVVEVSNDAKSKNSKINLSCLLTGPAQYIFKLCHLYLSTLVDDSNSSSRSLPTKMASLAALSSLP